MGDVTRTRVRHQRGVTKAERYLNKLCKRTFLSLWSYPGIYRNQGQGKEICDLIVVFDEHILIFSDKDCEFPSTGNLELDWRRWYRRAVEKSAKQIWGAERWIKSHPDRIFLDRSCTQKFPLALPNPKIAKYHRIVVAHGASDRCKKELGGSGSLMFVSNIIGEDHYMKFEGGGYPFSVGSVDPAKGHVHVLDDTTLDILLNTLDTITDFVQYLTKKEQFIQNNNLHVAGEEDLLAYYLKYLNEDEEHDFVMPVDVPSRINAIVISEGFWEKFIKSPERKAQIVANQISYGWDALIESFSLHILNNTQYYYSHPGIDSSEKIIRFLAREPRIRRRFLATLLYELIERTPFDYQASRVILPSKSGEPFYVLLLFPYTDDYSYEEYRKIRRGLLVAYCMVTKLTYPHANDIVGIATESGLKGYHSEDSMYLDARIWNQEDKIEAQRVQNELGLLTKTTMSSGIVHEYPELDSTKHEKPSSQKAIKKYPRNKPCLCGSGKKYKKCCGSRKKRIVK